MEVDLRSEVSLLRRLAGRACPPGWHVAPMSNGFRAGPAGHPAPWIRAAVSGGPPARADARATVLEPLGAGWMCLRFEHPDDLSTLEAEDLHGFVAALVDQLTRRAPGPCQSRVRRASNRSVSGRRR